LLPVLFPFFFSSRRRHTRFSRDWSSDVCSSDLFLYLPPAEEAARTEALLYEGRDKTGVDPWETLRGFIDRTDRVLALMDGFMPRSEERRVGKGWRDGGMGGGAKKSK